MQRSFRSEKEKEKEKEKSSTFQEPKVGTDGSKGSFYKFWNVARMTINDIVL